MLCLLSWWRNLRFERLLRQRGPHGVWWELVYIYNSTVYDHELTIRDTAENFNFSFPRWINEKDFHAETAVRKFHQRNPFVDMERLHQHDPVYVAVGMLQTFNDWDGIKVKVRYPNWRKPRPLLSWRPAAWRR